MNSTQPLAPRPAEAGEARLEFRRGGASPSDREWLRRRTEDIVGLLYRGACDIVRIGQWLEEAKSRLPHGVYEDWVENCLPFSLPTAWRYRQVARAFGEFQNFHFERFDELALYALAQPRGVPPAARAHAAQLASEGQKITRALALEILDAHRPVSEADAVRELKERQKSQEARTKCIGRRPDGEYCGEWFVGTGQSLCPRCERRLQSRGVAEASAHREKAKKWDLLCALAGRSSLVRIERVEDADYEGEDVTYSVTAHPADESQPVAVGVHSNLFVALAKASAERNAETGELVEPMKRCLDPQCAAPGGMRPYGAFKCHAGNPDGFDTRCRECENRRKEVVRVQKRQRKARPPQPDGAQAA
jgi:hypothetical protein